MYARSYNIFEGMQEVGPSQVLWVSALGRRSRDVLFPLEIVLADADLTNEAQIM
jgi:hypothetical protein